MKGARRWHVGILRFSKCDLGCTNFFGFQKRLMVIAKRLPESLNPAYHEFSGCLHPGARQNSSRRSKARMGGPVGGARLCRRPAAAWSVRRTVERRRPSEPERIKRLCRPTGHRSTGRQRGCRDWGPWFHFAHHEFSGWPDGVKVVRLSEKHLGLVAFRLRRHGRCHAGCAASSGCLGLFWREICVMPHSK